MENNNNIDEILKEGYEHLEKGDIQKAQEVYLEGVKSHNDSIALINNLAQTYAMMGDMKKSKEYHKRLVELCEDEKSAELLMLKANSQMSLNDFSDALETYRKILNENPKNTPALFQISAIYAERGEMEKSNEHLDMVLAIEKNNIVALMRKGDNYFMAEDYEKAQTYYDRVLDISPKHEGAIRHKGKLLKQIGANDELKRHISTTLKVKPDSAYTLMLKAMDFANDNDDENALEFFNRAISIDPSLDEAYFNKAGFLMLKKRYDEAIECYEKAFKINPESGGIIDREGLFELLAQMKNAVQ